MDTYQFVIELVKIAVPVVVAFLAFFLGRSSRFDTKRETASQKRLEEYYWPLVKEYMTSFFWVSPYSNANDEVTRRFYDLIVVNSYLASKQTQQIIPDFHRVHLAVSEAPEGGPEHVAHCAKELDLVFIRVIDSVWQEYKILCKQQGYPDPLELRLPLVFEYKSKQ